MTELSFSFCGGSMGKNVLLIGSGGREHAIAWKLAQSPLLGKLYIAPGNPGTAELGENVPIKSTDIQSLINFALRKGIHCTIVSTEELLRDGIVDEFQKWGLPIFGPTQMAAKIEWSKIFAKVFMTAHGIPTAPYYVTGSYENACAFVKNHPGKLVIKDDGLAAGKGVHVCEDTHTALRVLSSKMSGRYRSRNAEDDILIEEYITGGPEFSAHAFSDGNSFYSFPPSKDYKTLGDGDVGPNTGGMGAIAPLSCIVYMPSFWLQTNKIVKETLHKLKEQEIPFVGCLYPGMKISPAGLHVLEFNARFGDPEAQVYMRLLKSDLLEIIIACIEGRLSQTTIEWHDDFAVCVVLASHGYPSSDFWRGLPITGLEEAKKISSVEIFHAGTEMSGEVLRTSGGRVLNVTARDPDFRIAIEKAYVATKLIHFDGMYYRQDIGAGF